MKKGKILKKLFTADMEVRSGRIHLSRITGVAAAAAQVLSKEKKPMKHLAVARGLFSYGKYLLLLSCIALQQVSGIEYFYSCQLLAALQNRYTKKSDITTRGSILFFFLARASQWECTSVARTYRATAVRKINLRARRRHMALEMVFY
uniref:Uncharacterized protein n=1 Tax=Trichogramma kaykai TaxID=54128 RepID=A0ABD2XFB1_9HYME